MSVEDWARREAHQNWNTEDKRLGYFSGLVDMADRLLSDEAVEAAGQAIFWSPSADPDAMARAALQAAIDAVTKEDGNE